MSRILTVAFAALAISGGAAFAQCADEQTTGSISKDGSTAPLETESEADAGGGTDGETDGEIAKDGATMPLEQSEDQAMSSDDVEAQQEGEDAAAAAADDCAEDDAG